jgi:hypothetical protein
MSLRDHRRATWLTGVVLAAGTAVVLAGTGIAGAGEAGTGAVTGTAAAADNGTTVTVAASADTYVVAERPTLAYGTENKLTAATWSTWHTESYLRFEVPAAPVGRRIVGAHLDVRFQRLDQQPAAVELRSVTGSWSEATTYGTRPTVGAVVAAASLPGQGTTALRFNLTGAVTAPGAYSVAMTNPTPESVASIHSREASGGAYAPTLTVQYGPRTLCGASFVAESGETYQQALAREDALFNGLESVRVFYSGLPQAWPGKLDAAGRPMIISFKATPADVIAGTHDTRLRDWFRTAPVDQDIYWTYFHEPENDIQNGAFTAAQFRQAWQRIAGLSREANNPRLRATLILMGWSVDPASGRNWRDYYPGRSYVDVIGWDLYNPSWKNGGYRTPSDLFATIVATSRAEGLPFGVAETGSPIVTGDDGTRRAAWVRDMITYLTAEGALFIEYFDLDWSSHNGADYRLRDPAGVAAWREFCS